MKSNLALLEWHAKYGSKPTWVLNRGVGSALKQDWESSLKRGFVVGFEQLSQEQSPMSTGFFAHIVSGLSFYLTATSLRLRARIRWCQVCLGRWMNRKCGGAAWGNPKSAALHTHASRRCNEPINTCVWFCREAPLLEPLWCLLWWSGQRSNIWLGRNAIEHSASSSKEI